MVVFFILWILCKKQKKNLSSSQLTEASFRRQIPGKEASASREGPSKEVNERQTFLTSEFKFTLKLPYGKKTELTYLSGTGTCYHSHTPEGICKLSFCIFTLTWHCYRVSY